MWNLAYVGKNFAEGSAGLRPAAFLGATVLGELLNSHTTKRDCVSPFFSRIPVRHSSLCFRTGYSGGILIKIVEAIFKECYFQMIGGELCLKCLYHIMCFTRV